jgi:hypothetical protein
VTGLQAKGRAGKANASQKKPGEKPSVGAHPRLTLSWLSAEKKDVKSGCLVKTAAGTELKVQGRWTRRRKDGTTVPFTNCEVLKLAPSATVAPLQRQSTARTWPSPPRT